VARFGMQPFEPDRLFTSDGVISRLFGVLNITSSALSETKNAYAGSE